MQKDMHYFGTYAMFRAAGLAPKVCQIIATAAEFVDDNGEHETIEFLDGGRLDFIPYRSPFYRHQEHLSLLSETNLGAVPLHSRQ